MSGEAEALHALADRLVTPAFEAVRFVAPIAWVPFAALWFGTGIGLRRLCAVLRPLSIPALPRRS